MPGLKLICGKMEDHPTHQEHSMYANTASARGKGCRQIGTKVVWYRAVREYVVGARDRTGGG